MLGLLAALFVGLVNGIVIAKLKVNSMIATLAMQMIIRGFIYILTQGVGKPNFPDSYNVIGRTVIAGMQTPIYYSLILAYAFTGLMAGISGLLLAARMGGPIPTQGQNMEMNVIAGCVIGGCSVSGGEGTMFGSFLGVIVMSLVTNAFNILGVDIYWQRTILGTIFLIAVLADVCKKQEI